MTAVDEVLIPIQCEYYALEGLGQLLSNINLIKEHLNPDLLVSTILLTMYDGRTKLADQVANEVRKHFGPKVLTTSIPRSVKISEAPGFRQSVMTYDPGSRGAMSYWTPPVKSPSAERRSCHDRQVTRWPGSGTGGADPHRPQYTTTVSDVLINGAPERPAGAGAPTMWRWLGNGGAGRRSTQAER